MQQGDGPSDFSTVHEVFEDYFQRIERGEEPRITDLVGDRSGLRPRFEKLMSTMLRLEGLATPGANLELLQSLGDYRIVREIGQGGMGIVYEAVQVSLGRRVALKVITAARNITPVAVTRFRREAAVASRLDHPGLCAVHDAGTDDGTPYIAMAFVEGRTLAQVIRNRQKIEATTPETIMERNGMLRIVEDVARALHHAHECGVIHRDVKPGNIMIRPDGAPVVLDFGLARNLDDGDPTLTLPGDVLGTPAYMAPEQLRGEATDRRTDVWALGVTLYEVLTQRRPFEGPTRESLFQVIQTKEMPDPRRIDASISRDLVTVLETALAKNNNRRYTTALDLAEDLRRTRERKPIAAHPVARWMRLLLWAQRRPVHAALVVILSIGLPVLAGMSTYIIAKMPAIERQAEADRSRITESHLVRGFSLLRQRDLLGSEVQFRAAWALSPENAEALGGLVVVLIGQKRSGNALDLLNEGHELVASESALGRLRSQALEDVGRKAEAQELLAAQRLPDTPLGYFLAGGQALRRGYVTQDSAAFTLAFACFERTIMMSKDARRLHYYELAHAAGHLEDPMKARLVAQFVTHLWPDDSEAWYSAGYAIASFDPEQAISHFEKAIAIDDGMARAWGVIGRLHLDAGRNEKAEAALRKSVELDAGRRIPQYNLGVALIRIGREADAIAPLRACLEIDPEAMVAFQALGKTLATLGRNAEAIEAWRAGLEVDPNDAQVLQLLAYFLRDIADDAEGSALLFERLARMTPNVPEGWMRLAKLQEKLGEFDAAIEAYRQVLRILPDNAAAKRRLADLED